MAAPEHERVRRPGQPRADRRAAPAGPPGRRPAARAGHVPVFPGYFGTVPEDFGDRNGGAHTVPRATGTACRARLARPAHPVFREVAAAFYRHQHDLLGAADLFKMDLLHEGGDPGDVPVPDAARAVETALRAARPVPPG
ncbi:alpha-N-acetylglucosaminidase TIM-barrel domain-containing protein [Streptomyces sp. M19]